MNRKKYTAYNFPLPSGGRKLWLVLLALLASAPVRAADLGIAAVVNGQAISSYDVDNRMRFILATTKISGTPDMAERIRPQVIQSLIDEKLQAAEAAKNSITLEDGEVDKAIAGIERQRGMAEGAIFRMLEQAGVPRETFIRQITAQLLWNRLMIKKVRPRVKVTDEEIDLAREKFSRPAVRQELKIAALTLPVDKPSRDGEVRKLADKLVGEVRAGASFEEVARQFSSGAPEPFWVRPEQMDPKLGRALMDGREGMITAPIRTDRGYTIVKVYEMRALGGDAAATDTEIQFREILLKLKDGMPQKEADALLAIGQEVAKHPGACEDKGVAGVENLEDFDIEANLRRDFLSDLPPALRALADSLKVGEISTPFASAEGIRLYMLCGRKEGVAKSVDRERIGDRLFAEKMELEAQKYMRNLRREAFIEVRK